MLRSLAGCAALLLLGAAPVPQLTPVDYELAPVMAGDAIAALAVTIRFRGDASGTTRLAWPEEWAGEEKLAQWSRDVSVEGARSVTEAANGTRVIRAAPGAPITVRYRIVSAYDADPTVENSRQPAPVVRPGWFYAVGEALFAAPEGRDDARARFRWTGPAAIGFASDLEQAPERLTVADVQESIAIGGRDLHVSEQGPPGRAIRIARIGRFGFDPAAFDALALKVVAIERNFWGARNEGPFLITMTPVGARPGRLSYGGTGRSDAFALWVDTSVPVDSLAWLLAHEYFHSWNPRRMGAITAGTKPADYWLSEGFTDFYARRLLLRAGVIDAPKFASLWNEMLRDYAVSSYRTAPNAKVAADFWRNGDADKMQYQRGALLAALWNDRLRDRRVPGGLDAVMRAQVAAVARRRDRPRATAMLAETLRHYGADAAPAIAAHVDRGEPIRLPADTFGGCARVETAMLPAFERGWDADAAAARGNVVTGLDPASNAWAAGLRDGMTILARPGGEPGNAAVDYVLKVRDGTAERTIRFRPAGRTTVETQRIVLDPAALARDPDGCRRSLSG